MTRLRIALCAQLILATGCPADKIPAGEPCDVGDACQGVYICFEGACRMPCNSDEVCARNETCRRGVCLPAAEGGDPAPGDSFSGDPAGGDSAGGDPAGGDTAGGDTAGDGASTTGDQGVGDAAGDPGPGDQAGDSGVGYVNEGTPTSPVDITTSMPHAGQVAINGASYYRITGATAGAVYTIHLTRTDGAAYLMVPNAGGGGGSNSCGWDNTTLGAVIDCAMVADSSGRLNFQARGDNVIGGAFGLTFEAGGFVNEGGPASPVVVTAYPFTGTALIQSYYLLSGLTPGGAYSIDFATASAAVGLFIYPDTYQAGGSICSTLSTNPGNPCNVIADSGGAIYLMTNVQADPGVSYTISVESASVANEGTQNDPIDISSALPYDGMVHTRSSWYLLSGLTPGSAYTVTLSNATDSANLYLYGPSFSISRVDCYFYWANGGGSPIGCVAAADSNGDIHIEVRGFDTADGATYTLDLVAGGLPNEGNYSAPIDITSSMPWSGTIYNGPSYYVVTRRALATDYTVTLDNLTDNAELWVYDTGEYTSLLCSSSELGTATESCTTQTSTGELHMRVTGAFNVKGATYTLDVSP